MQTISGEIAAKSTPSWCEGLATGPGSRMRITTVSYSSFRSHLAILIMESAAGS